MSTRPTPMLNETARLPADSASANGPPIASLILFARYISSGVRKFLRLLTSCWLTRVMNASGAYHNFTQSKVLEIDESSFVHALPAEITKGRPSSSAYLSRQECREACRGDRRIRSIGNTQGRHIFESYYQPNRPAFSCSRKTTTWCGEVLITSVGL